MVHGPLTGGATVRLNCLYRAAIRGAWGTFAQEPDSLQKVPKRVPAGQERGNLTNAAGRRCGPEVAAPGALLPLSEKMWRNVIAVL